MAKSQDTFSKKEKEKKRLKKRKEKEIKKEERKASSKGGGLENMMAYIDEHGNIVDTPPDPTKKIEFDVESIEIGVAKRVDELPEVKTGKIEFFNETKGFGFIKEIGTNEKFFVHVNGLLQPVKENDKVTFELEKGLKGMNAVKVKIVK